MTAWRGVRWREDVGWEMRCDVCAAQEEARYWPLTHEFWDYKHGLSRCRACWSAYERRARGRRGPVGYVRAKARRTYQREWSARKREQQRADEGRKLYERKAKAA